MASNRKGDLEGGYGKEQPAPVGKGVDHLPTQRALLPLVLARQSWPPPRAWRLLCWAGAAVLLVWGGVNTIIGNLVLTGAINPAGGYDRDGMVGHAWLWDPLFLIWGIALAVALLLTRHRDR